MDKLLSMKTFVRIVETGSLTAAANERGTSLPTVVRTLAALEQDLGVRLLNRTTRRIHLTDDGAEYLERCRIILSAVEEADEALVSRRGELQGKLTVTASVQFGRRFIGPILTQFLEHNSGLTADLLLLDRVVNLVEEGIDVAIRIAQLRDSSLIAVPVGQVRRVICASEQYLARHGVPQDPADAVRHRCVRHTVLTPRSEWNFRVDQRNVSIPISPVLTSNEIESVLNACISGLGLGMFLSYMVAPYVGGGQLTYVLEQFEVEPVPVQIVYSASRLMSNRVRAFVDYCASELRRAPFD
jgi:DNA-binding transcriptional LysR family regulator